MAGFSPIVETEVIIRAIRNNFLSDKKSKEAGKPSPVYENKEYLVFKRTDGTQFVRPAYPADRENKEYTKVFEAFDEKKNATDEGTLLGELQGITPAEQATLEEIHCGTVEILAQMSLSQAKELAGNGRYVSLRDYAQSFLKQREDMEEVFTLRKASEEKDLEILRLKELAGEELGTKKPRNAVAVSGQEDVEDAFFGDAPEAPVKKRRGRPARVETIS